jgi:hypothetical protein
VSERDGQTDDPQASPTGVDVTLIDEMLRMTVRQRLEQNDRMAALSVRLRAAFEATEAKDRSQFPVLGETLRRRGH